MKSDIPITKEMKDAIVQISLVVKEFSKLYDWDQPESPKNIFECNEHIKKGLNWFIRSENQKEMLHNISAYIQCVDTALELHENLNIKITNQDKMIVQLKRLKVYLIDLQNQMKINPLP